MSAKGCIGNLSLVAAGTVVNSTTGDLSGFGCEPQNWVNVRVTSTAGVFNFYVNDRLAYALKAKHMPSAIVGVQYRFDGPAAIGKALFTANGRQYKLL